MDQIVQRGNPAPNQRRVKVETITIAGEAFQAPVKYEEGHELTAGEALALNRTYHENLRNNFAQKVKDAKENGSFDLSALQSEFEKYAEDYAFGVRRARGVARDPVMIEALSIAKAQIKAVLKKKGIKGKVDPAALTAKAKQLIDRDDRIMAIARQRVQEAQEAAASDLDDLVAGLPSKAA